MAKGFLDARTRDKIKVKGGDYLPTLLEFVEEENLPTFLGGKSADSDTFPTDVGPWNDYEIVGNVLRKKGEGQAVEEEKKEEETKEETKEEAKAEEGGEEQQLAE